MKNKYVVILLVIYIFVGILPIFILSGSNNKLKEVILENNSEKLMLEENAIELDNELFQVNNEKKILEDLYNKQIDISNNNEDIVVEESTIDLNGNSITNSHISTDLNGNKIEFELCEIQFSTGKLVNLTSSDMYVLPDENTYTLNKNRSGLVKVLYEVKSNGTRWAYIQPMSPTELNINAYGYVKYDMLESIEGNYEINQISLSENFSIGMTLDAFKAKLGTHYLVVKEFEISTYIFYNNEERLIKEIKNVNNNSFTRAGYEDAIICGFTNETNQLRSIQITTSSIEVIEEISINDEYEKVKSICDNRFNLSADENNEGTLTYIWEVGPDTVELVFIFEVEDNTLKRLDINYYNN